MAIKHAFTSQKSDGADATLVRPSDWNASHTGNGLPFLLVVSNDATADVKSAADYLCDGTADNVQIQQAIDALPSTGGCIQLSGGRFYIASQIQINKDAVIFQGIGYSEGVVGRGTVLYAVTGVTGSIIRVSSGAFAGSYPVGVCQIRNLTIDGGGGTATPVGTGVEGIEFSSYNALIENVRVYAMSGAGIDVRGTSTPSGWDTYNTRIIGVIINDCTGSGIYFGEHSSDCQVLGLVSYSNDEDGIQTGGSSIQFVDCHIYGNTRYGLYIPSGSARVKVTTSKFEHNGQHGINISGSQAVIVGCNTHINGKTTDNTYANIYLNAGEAVIVGNSIGNDTGEGGNTPAYGIQVTSAGSGLIASNHVFDGASAYGTAKFTNASIWMEVVANGGIVSRNYGSASITTGGTIAHGLYTTPTAWGVFPIAATPTGIYATADGTNLTVTFGGGGTQTFKWWAEV